MLTTHFLDALLAGNRLARALAGAGVGARALAADRQTAAVAQTAVTANVAQPGDVLLNLSAQRTFDRVFAVEQSGDAREFLVAQLLGAALGIDAGLFAQAQGQGRPDAVKVTQRNVRRLVVGDV